MRAASFRAVLRVAFSAPVPTDATLLLTEAAAAFAGRPLVRFDAGLRGADALRRFDGALLAADLPEVVLPEVSLPDVALPDVALPLARLVLLAERLLAACDLFDSTGFPWTEEDAFDLFACRAGFVPLLPSPASRARALPALLRG